MCIRDRHDFIVGAQSTGALSTEPDWLTYISKSVNEASNATYIIFWSIKVDMVLFYTASVYSFNKDCISVCLYMHLFTDDQVMVVLDKHNSNYKIRKLHEDHKSWRLLESWGGGHKFWKTKLLVEGVDMTGDCMFKIKSFFSLGILGWQKLQRY